MNLSVCQPLIISTIVLIQMMMMDFIFQQIFMLQLQKMKNIGRKKKMMMTVMTVMTLVHMHIVGIGRTNQKTVRLVQMMSVR